MGETPPALGRRPNTLSPTEFISITSDELMQMSPQELVEFAAYRLGRVLDPSDSKSKLLTAIRSAAIAARNG